MNGQVEIRQCTSLKDFSACVSLQRIIWREQDLEVHRVVDRPRVATGCLGLEVERRAIAASEDDKCQEGPHRAHSIA